MVLLEAVNRQGWPLSLDTDLPSEQSEQGGGSLDSWKDMHNPAVVNSRELCLLHTWVFKSQASELCSKVLTATHTTNSSFPK